MHVSAANVQIYNLTFFDFSLDYEREHYEYSEVMKGSMASQADNFPAKAVKAVKCF